MYAPYSGVIDVPLAIGRHRLSEEIVPRVFFALLFRLVGSKLALVQRTASFGFALSRAAGVNAVSHRSIDLFAISRAVLCCNAFENARLDFRARRVSPTTRLWMRFQISTPSAAATLRHDDMATERTYIMIKCVCERDAGEARTRTIVARETSSFFSRDATRRDGAIEGRWMIGRMDGSIGPIGIESMTKALHTTERARVHAAQRLTARARALAVQAGWRPTRVGRGNHRALRSQRVHLAGVEDAKREQGTRGEALRGFEL